MHIVDAFNSDLFTVRALTDAITDMPYVPKELGQWLPWQVTGEITDKLMIEMREGTLSLLQEQERGTIGQQEERGERDAFTVNIPHYPQTETIKPAEIMGVRAFGTDDQLETIEMRRNEKLSTMRRKNEVMWEFGKAGAISGVLYKKNGTVSKDWFQIFGKQRTTHDIDFANANVNLAHEITNAKEKSEDELGEFSADGYLLVCGRNINKAFREHPSMEKLFDRPDYGALLRADLRPGFSLSTDVNIVSYGRAKVGNTWFIDPDEAFLLPLADGMYQGRMAPGDSLSAANTIGQPEYSSAHLLPHEKGIELHCETNPLFYVQRPQAIVRIRQK